jgi:hypothetical protein
MLGVVTKMITPECLTTYVAMCQQAVLSREKQAIFFNLPTSSWQTVCKNVFGGFSKYPTETTGYAEPDGSLNP